MLPWPILSMELVRVIAAGDLERGRVRTCPAGRAVPRTLALDLHAQAMLYVSATGETSVAGKRAANAFRSEATIAYWSDSA